jgi:hypothetical protein
VKLIQAMIEHLPNYLYQEVDKGLVTSILESLLLVLNYRIRKLLSVSLTHISLSFSGTLNNISEYAVECFEPVRPLDLAVPSLKRPVCVE